MEDVKNRRGESVAMRLALAAMSGLTFIPPRLMVNLQVNNQPDKFRRVTQDDVDRLDAAQDKRDRKAAKRMGKNHEQ